MTRQTQQTQQSTAKPLRVVITGASGMIGGGVLDVCLASDEIAQVITLGRSSPRAEHEKLVDVRHSDFTDFSAIEDRLTDVDACFWCLGISSAGMSEADYRRVTVDFTRAGAESMLRASPSLAMCFVSGQGTDGRAMWARAKSDAEQLLLQMPFSSATMFRPGFIEPAKGRPSRVRGYRLLYAALTPFMPLFRNASFAVNPEIITKAMIAAARGGAPKPILEVRDIRKLAGL